MGDGTWYEKQASGAKLPLRFKGMLLRDGSGSTTLMPLTLRKSPPGYNPVNYVPLAPALAYTQTARTTVTFTITPPVTEAPRSGITGYRVWRSLGAGTPLAVLRNYSAATTTWSDTDLVAATPESVYNYAIQAISPDGYGAMSNVVSFQWQAAPTVQQPVAPTGFATSGTISTTSIPVTWSVVNDPSVAKQGIFLNGSIFRDNIGAAVKTYTLNGLLADTSYGVLDVRRYNGWSGGSPAGWSPASNGITAKTLANQTSGGPLFTGHQPGKVILGWSTDQGDSFADDQLDTFAPGGGSYSSKLGVKRIYSWSTTDANYADSHGRMLALSFKTDKDFGGSGGPAGWRQLTTGALDNAIKNYFQPIVARNKLTLCVLHHEPVGDATDPVADGTAYTDAFRHLIKLVDATYPGNRLIFAPNYEENRLRNLKVNNITIDWSKWLPQNMINNRANGGWDLITWDVYQYNATVSTSTKAGVQFSHRWWRIHDLFTGAFVPTGSTAMPYMTFNPGVDVVFGILEGSARPGAFYAGTSDMTGAKYARDYLDFVFNNPAQFAIVSWFNSIGKDPVYNEERLIPLGTTSHPDLTTQTGDTERSIDVYREKLNTGLTAKPVL